MNNGKINIEHKWGFGHAPLKSATAYKNRKAIVALLKHIRGELLEIDLEAISLVKGLINRCIRKDQWDWFTVYTLLGRPEITTLTSIAALISQYRTAIKMNEVNKMEKLKQNLMDKGLVVLLENYLGKNEVELEGYIYILSRREEPNILKIGMTTRDVELRLKEINSATGVLYPYSVRCVFKVGNPKEAERRVFEELSEFRIRKDREFFNMEFKQAQSIIGKCLEESNLK